MYLPLHNVPTRKFFFRIPVTILFIFTVSLVLLAFITCILITMYKDFEEANNTHCKVPNIFPSISACIGNFEPQRTIWRTAIYLQAPLRFFWVYLRTKFYLNVIRQDCLIVAKLAVFLNILENIALIGLTHWTSTLSYSYHETCFKMFIGCSILYMLFTCMMLSKYRRRLNITKMEKHSVKLKWRAFLINVGSFAFAAYCFVRHNELCEPYELITEAPWYVSNAIVHHDLDIPTVKEEIQLQIKDTRSKWTAI